MPAQSDPESPPKLKPSPSDADADADTESEHEPPLVVASPIRTSEPPNQAPADKTPPATQRSANSDQAVCNREESSDSELDADIRAEVRQSFAYHQGRADRKERKLAKKKEKAADKPSNNYGPLGALQLPEYYVADEVKWASYMPTHNINSFLGSHRWQMLSANCKVQLYKDCDEREPRSPFFYFSHSFPMRHLSIIEELTNVALSRRNFGTTTRNELLSFFGLILLIPCLRDIPCCDLWRAQARTVYGMAANLGRTGMSRKRFEILLSCVW